MNLNHTFDITVYTYLFTGIYFEKEKKKKNSQGLSVNLNSKGKQVKGMD